MRVQDSYLHTDGLLRHRDTSGRRVLHDGQPPLVLQHLLSEKMSECLWTRDVCVWLHVSPLLCVQHVCRFISDSAFHVTSYLIEDKFVQVKLLEGVVLSAVGASDSSQSRREPPSQGEAPPERLEVPAEETLHESQGKHKCCALSH